MKALKIVGGVVGVLFVLMLYVVLTPTYGRCLGVSIAARGFQTNAAGQVAPLYSISNTSTRPVLVIPAIERRPLPHAVIDMMGNTQQVLAAHAEILVVISNTPPERATVHCQRERFFGDGMGLAKRKFTTYLLFRKETEMVYP
jgi:hypothetical protein